MAKPIVILDTPNPTLQLMALRAGLTEKEVKELEALVRAGIRTARPRAQGADGKKPKPLRRTP